MALGELLLALSANMISAGLARGYGNIGRRVSARKNVVKALTNGPTLDNQSEPGRSFQLLSTVLGQKYNDNAVKLFNRMTMDGFAERIVHYTLSAEDSYEDLESIFTTKYAALLQDIEIDNQALFAAIVASTEYTTGAAFADPELASMIRSIAREQNERLKSIAKSIKALAGTNEPTGYDEVAISSKLTKLIQVTNRDIAVETNRGRKRYSIDRIFIKSRIAHISDESKLSPLPLFVDDRDGDRYISYNDFATSFQRAVVLGDPGGGKSTLCQSLCFELSKKASLALRHQERHDLDFSSAKIPLRVILRDYEKRHERDHVSIFDYLVDEVSTMVGEPKSVINYWLRVQLTLGQVVVAFDGVDEVLEVVNRRKYVQKIEEFAHAWEASAILCTSRIIGYNKAPLGSDFDLFELARFSRAESQEYATSLIALIEGKKKDQCVIQAEQFVKQTDESARDLRQNPLMLGLMVWLFIAQGHVPRHKAAIYSECATLMFEKWDKDRGIRANIPDDFDLMELFAHLASKIFGNKELEVGVDNAWLDGVMYRFFERWYEDKARARNAAVRLREFVTGRSWIMTDVGPGRYAFTHRTFLEYFFARSIVARFDAVSRIIHELKAKISAREWDVICHLAVQGLCYQNSRRSEECVDTLIALQKNRTLGEEKRSNVLLFMAHASEYLILTDGYVRKLFRALIEHGEMLSKSASYRGESPALVGARVRGANGEIFLDEAERALDRAIKGRKAESIERFVAFLLGSRIVPANYDESMAVLDALKERVRGKLERYATEDIVVARLVLFLYPKTLQSLFRIYGDRLLTGTDFGEFGARGNHIIFAIQNELSLERDGNTGGLVSEIADMVRWRMDENRPFAIERQDLVSYPFYLGGKFRIVDGKIRYLGRGKARPGELEFVIMANAEMATLGTLKESTNDVGSKVLSGRRNRNRLVRAYKSNRLSPLFEEWLAGRRSMFRLV